MTDYHEMGTNSTYYFEPSEPRASWNPLIPERMYTGITEDFARYFVASLDSLGSLYFTKENYDNSYPGYGSTYPKFQGGYAITFEQAGSRGIAQESDHHGVLTFAFAIRNHVRTSLATVRAAVDQRRTLQAYQRDFFESALREAEAFGVKAYVFGDPYDASKNRAFLDLLLRHRLEVYELPRTLSAGGQMFEPGSAWMVPTRQPQYRLVRSLFERTNEYADSSFYDASTWTTSLAYGLPDAEIRGSRPALGARVTEVPQPREIGTLPRSAYTYLLDWSDYAAPRALYYLQSRGVHAEVAFAPFTARTHEGGASVPARDDLRPRADSGDRRRFAAPAGAGGGAGGGGALPEPRYRLRGAGSGPGEPQLPRDRGAAGGDAGGGGDLAVRGGDSSGTSWTPALHSPSPRSIAATSRAQTSDDTTRSSFPRATTPSSTGSGWRT